MVTERDRVVMAAAEDLENPIVLALTEEVERLRTENLRLRVWMILRDECGALDNAPGDFIHWPECREYRFMGALGFGGKVWFNRQRFSGGRCPIYVTYYPEDETPEIKRMSEDANARFAGEFADYEHSANSGEESDGSVL